MSVGESNLHDLLERLSTPDPQLLAEEADRLTDWLQSFDAAEGALLGRRLVGLAASHTNEDVTYEALVHALAELADSGLLPVDVLRAGAALPEPPQPSSVSDYLQLFGALLEDVG